GSFAWASSIVTVVIVRPLVDDRNGNLTCSSQSILPEGRAVCDRAAVCLRSGVLAHKFRRGFFARILENLLWRAGFEHAASFEHMHPMRSPLGEIHRVRDDYHRLAGRGQIG